MKMMLVANSREDVDKYSMRSFDQVLRAQIENSLQFGWHIDDIIILANFNFEYMGVRSLNIKLNDFCWTGSKVFGMKWLYENVQDIDVIWSRDCDTWQNAEFVQPEFKDVGIACYSKPKYNGGSIFWRRAGKDILDAVVDKLTKDLLRKEEPTINEIFKSDLYKDRVTVLNSTFNVGCSGYVKRYDAADKPIRVCHFHPTNKIAWETHALDRNGTGNIGISKKLEIVIRKHYPNLAIELTRRNKHVKNDKKK